jgi:hypothetical protein
MEFFENYRKKYNDLLIAVENFDISLSDEFYTSKSVNTDKIVKYQIRKFEVTFEMFLEQIKLHLVRIHQKTSRSMASLIMSFYNSTHISETSYEILLEMSNYYRKMSMAYEENNPNFNRTLFHKLETFYSTMLLCIKYLDYDDSELYKLKPKRISLPSGKLVSEF